MEETQQLRDQNKTFRDRTFQLHYTVEHAYFDNDEIWSSPYLESLARHRSWCSPNTLRAAKTRLRRRFRAAVLTGRHGYISPQRVPTSRTDRDIYRLLS
ncbi:hypothetical protein Trydic_g11440 [Trypoxylus dichotomus]